MQNFLKLDKVTKLFITAIVVLTAIIVINQIIQL